MLRRPRSDSVSRGRKSQTPLRTVNHQSPAVLKPAMLLADLRRRARDLPVAEFALPQSGYTTAVFQQTTQFSHHAKSAAETRFNPAEMLKMDLKEKLKSAHSGKKDEKAASPAPSTSSLQRQPVIGVKKPINVPVASAPGHQTFRQAGPPRLANQVAFRNGMNAAEVQAYREAKKREAALDTQTAPSSSFIISLKPADSSLLPNPVQSRVQKDGLDVKQKRGLLESLVNKISLTKKEDGNWSVNSSMTSSPSHITAVSSVSPATDLEPAERKKNKRKSSDPSKFITEEDEVVEEEQTKRRGGKRKKTGGRKPPPTKKRKTVEWKDEPEMIEWKEDPEWKEQITTEADELPPRIVVVGQEPGTELEWDEEEIIVLRLGEEPEQRPPTMKRKQAPEEAVKEEEEEEAVEEEEEMAEAERETTPVEANTTTMETTDEDEDYEEEQMSTAPVSLNSSQSSVYSADISSNLSCQSSQSSNGSSPIISTVSSVLSALTASVALPSPPLPISLPPLSSSLFLSSLPLSSPLVSRLSPLPLLASSLPPRTEKRDSIDSTTSSASSDSTSGGRAKRTVRARARYSPTPEDGPSISRCGSQTTLDSTGLHLNPQISPI